MAAPMPREAPVTSATRPSRKRISVVEGGKSGCRVGSGVGRRGRVAAVHHPFNAARDVASAWVPGRNGDGSRSGAARSREIGRTSRGAHTRIDFENERDEWLKVNIVTRKGADGRMEVRKVPRPDAPADLAAIAHAQIEDLEAGKVVIPKREPQPAPAGVVGK